MTLSCGIDIEEISRFSRYIKEENNSFFKIVFTEKEIENNRRINEQICFPLGFSCKEAVFKAFGMSWFNSSIQWKDIELLFLDKKNLYKYQVKLTGFAKQLYDDLRITDIRTNFEFTEDYVNFTVIMQNKTK